MKLVKMSLAAAVLLGTSAFAIDNLKISGDVKVNYSTNDSAAPALVSIIEANNKGGGLFDKETSSADAAVRLSAKGDLMKNLSFGATAYGVTTLGLEDSLVRTTWTGAHGVSLTNDYADVDNNVWLGEAWLAYTMSKTTAKVGRMELDTPLTFSEKWSIVPNTFEAAVLINQDLPDTTLVGAYVSKGNGGNIFAGLSSPSMLGAHLALDAGVVGEDAEFNTFMHGGAWAAAIVNNSFKPLVAQAWYYDVKDVADAYWLQADINCQMVKGLTIGGQYANMSPKGVLVGKRDSDAYAVKLGYAVNDALKVSVAYSETDDKGVLNVANVATTTGQSKLYTEAWWNYGYVSAPGAESWNVTAEFDAGVAKLGAYYTSVSNQIVASTRNVDEIALTASKSFGPLDATLAYISTDADDQQIDPITGTGQKYNTVQAYLTYNF